MGILIHILLVFALLLQGFVTNPAAFELLRGAVVTTSTGLKNAQLDRLLNAAAGTSFNSGNLQIWTGAAPGASNAPTGTKLWDLTLDADGFAAASAGSAAMNGTGSAAAIAAGTAGYWRLVKTGDLGTTNTTDERIEGDCTATGGGGAMTLQNLVIASAQTITLSTKTVSHG